MEPLLGKRPSQHYAYAGNNPVSFVDPDGFDITSWDDKSSWIGSRDSVTTTLQMKTNWANPQEKVLYQDLLDQYKRLDQHQKYGMWTWGDQSPQIKENIYRRRKALEALYAVRDIRAKAAQAGDKAIVLEALESEAGLLKDFGTLSPFDIAQLQLKAALVAPGAAGRFTSTPATGEAYLEGLRRSVLQQAVQVFRVEGAANARLVIGEGGQVAVADGERMLFLNFGSRARAEEFLARRLSQGMTDATMKSFQVPKSFLDELRATAVPESMAGTNPGKPILVDVTKAPDQYGLRAAQIDALRRAILQGSGEVIK
jgi:hypothetical protein